MNFFALKPGAGLPPNPATGMYLLTDTWDDFRYHTTFRAVHVRSDKIPIVLGLVKIAQFGQTTLNRTELPERFESLPDSYFSLGQGDSYYLALQALPAKTRNSVFRALRDAAFDLSICDAAETESVFQISLLRDRSLASVRGQFNRIAHGGPRHLGFGFSFRPSSTPNSPEIRFAVVPNSIPPTNIHALIGRNGVGKSRALHFMTSLAIGDSLKAGLSTLTFDDEVGGSQFANVVYISFSAFDDLTPPSVPVRHGRPSFSYAHIGLRRLPDSRNMDVAQEDFGTPKSHEELVSEFLSSALAILNDESKSRLWLAALRELETDPGFRDYSIVALPADRDPKSAALFAERARSLFNALSSGHKIVLLSTTRLVEVAEERSLVLIDEPEAHLHPPLLSAYTRALSQLLTQTNGVCVLATHSPVVLQEVPSDCVTILRRRGSSSHFERPSRETFGEDVGTLTTEVFGLDVTESGFHRLVRDAVEVNDSVDAVVRHFDGHLGSEALALAQALMSYRKRQEAGG